jgi:hypothetical protein
MGREFEYAATLQDELGMFRDVLQAEDIVFYLWDWYRTRKPFFFRRVTDEVERRIRAKSGIAMFYLWSPAFSKHRVVLEPVEKREPTEPELFTIATDVGPLIAWSTSSGTRPESGIDTVAFGSIQHQSSYHDPKSDSFPRVPKELVDAYRRILKIVKKHLKRTVYKGKHFYVGHDALSRLDAGTLRIRGYGSSE